MVRSSIVLASGGIALALLASEAGAILPPWMRPSRLLRPSLDRSSSGTYEVIGSREESLALERALHAVLSKHWDWGHAVTPFFKVNETERATLLRPTPGLGKLCRWVSFEKGESPVVAFKFKKSVRKSCRNVPPVLIPPQFLRGDSKTRAVSLSELASRYPVGVEFDLVARAGRRRAFLHAASLVEFDRRILGEASESVFDFERMAGIYPQAEFPIAFSIRARFDPKVREALFSQKTRLSAGAISIQPERVWESENRVPFSSQDRVWEDAEGNLIFYFHPYPAPFGAFWQGWNPERLEGLFSSAGVAFPRCYRDEMISGPTPWDSVGCHRQVESANPGDFRPVLFIKFTPRSANTGGPEVVLYEEGSSGLGL